MPSRIDRRPIRGILAFAVAATVLIAASPARAVNPVTDEMLLNAHKEPFN